MQALTPRLAGAKPSATSTLSLCRCPSIATTRTLGASVSGRYEQPSAERCLRVRQRRERSCSSVVTRTTAVQVDAEVDDVGVSNAADAIIRYAIDLARASETYEVHSWMIVLGILKYESTTAAQILKQMGLDDLYGAWNEVLWALHVCDGLKPRSFTTEIGFADLAFKVVTGASNFAEWHGKDKMYSEDLLMALAAGGVLDGLFPDLNLSFDRVRKAVEKHSGRRYQLPDEPEAAEQPGPLKSADDVSFL